jgi:hypothetical protein
MFSVRPAESQHKRFAINVHAIIFIGDAARKLGGRYFFVAPLRDARESVGEGEHGGIITASPPTPLLKIKSIFRRGE